MSSNPIVGCATSCSGLTTTYEISKSFSPLAFWGFVEICPTSLLLRMSSIKYVFELCGFSSWDLFNLFSIDAVILFQLSNSVTLLLYQPEKCVPFQNISQIIMSSRHVLTWFCSKQMKREHSLPLLWRDMQKDTFPLYTMYNVHFTCILYVPLLFLQHLLELFHPLLNKAIKSLSRFS